MKSAADVSSRVKVANGPLKKDYNSLQDNGLNPLLFSDSSHGKTGKEKLESFCRTSKSTGDLPRATVQKAIKEVQEYVPPPYVPPVDNTLAQTFGGDFEKSNLGDRPKVWAK